MASAIHTLLDFLFPSECRICRKPVRESSTPFFCAACWSGIKFLDGPSCPRCGEPYVSPIAGDHLCPPCERRLPAFDRAMSACRYDGVIAEAIHLFKYGKKIGLGRPLGALLSEHLPRDVSADLVIPIPLHSRRLRAREYNQSLILAEVVARRRRIPLAVSVLKRTVDTRPQIGLKRSERRANVRGAFAAESRGLAGKRVLLIDDVYTTGATAGECAKALKSGGAESVVVATLARMPRT